MIEGEGEAKEVIRMNEVRPCGSHRGLGHLLGVIREMWHILSRGDP